MSEDGRQRAPEQQSVAGPRAHVLSVLALSFLALFVVVVLTLIVTDLCYEYLTLGTFIEIIGSPEVLGAIALSLVSSLITLLLVLIVAPPVGYALSRYRFFGHAVVDTIVDLPILLPPVVIGISLLVFFAATPGQQIEQLLEMTTGWSMHSIVGIVLCQFLVSISYAVRAAKAAFDAVDRRLEHMALSLGCTHLQAFRRVTVPLARTGMIAGAVMAWARALGVFGPLVVFVGTSSRVRVMPTTIYLELSIGREEVSLAVGLVMILMAGIALAVVHWLAPGRKWY